MKLTKDQDNALKVLTAFVDTIPVKEEDYYYTLAGFAGTGKSTLMNLILQDLKRNVKVAVSAPTHTAKEVIASFTGKNAETIQALLGLRPNTDLEDFNPNKPVFDVKAEERIQNYHLLVIDEASMLNKAMVKLIRKKANEHKVKVIFMGDKYQLPPIGEEVSDVFKLKNQVHLDEIVRQKKENPNIKLIELARNDVRDKTNNLPNYLKTIRIDMNKEEGFKYLDRESFYPALLEKYFDIEYQQNSKLVKTISWTNDTAKAINSYIRNKVLHSKELVAVGDILTGYKTLSEDIPNPPYYNTIVKNSVDYIVTDVQIVTKKVLGNLYKFYVTKAKGAEHLMNILHPDSYNDFIIEYAERLRKAKDYRMWKGYYTFKNNFVLKEDILVNGVLVVSKDIDYGYAITVHKSQGSTYENVAVIMGDINRNSITQERRKLLYVALSRTSKLNLIY
jgi:hypothetical protein